MNSDKVNGLLKLKLQVKESLKKDLATLEEKGYRGELFDGSSEYSYWAKVEKDGDIVHVQPDSITLSLVLSFEAKKPSKEYGRGFIIYDNYDNITHITEEIVLETIRQGKKKEEEYN